ncbi:MAG: hypothetical protein ACM3X3_11700 [Betaproteobacteria bacterium]
MGLRLYLDAACTQEVTATNPDAVHKAVVSGVDMTDERSLWIKSDDVALTYENIVLTSQGDDAQVDVKYAADNNGAPGTYADSLSLPNGDFAAAVRVWRKVTAPNVTATFKRTNINHSLTWDEYVI